ncbi:MAG TPA: TRAP transporter substrate-binding protein [Microvirga sp.]|nr:TRAP transporter substrate-binding protein [Microvirga sp.]
MLLAACAACIAAALPGQAREFRSAEVHPADYPTTKAVEYMGQLLKERSGGKHSIKVFPNAALGQERDAIEQLKLGGLDMMRINVAPLNNVVPETIVPALPFLFRSEDQMHQVLDGPVGEKILKAMEKQGMVGLAFYDSGARSLYTTKPVKTLADVKGMKIRVQQSDVFVAMVQALGASATPMPYGEVYTALTTGLIDAAENNYPSYESSRHFEVAKYYNLTEHSMAPEVLVFSKRIWDRLSAEEQAMIRQAAKDSVPHMRQLWRERESKSKDIVLKAGVQLVPIEDKEKWAEAMKPVFEKFAGTPELKSLIQDIQSAK